MRVEPLDDDERYAFEQKKLPQILYLLLYDHDDVVVVIDAILVYEKIL